MTKVLFCHGAQDRLQSAAAWLLQAGMGRQTAAATIVYAPNPRVAERFDQLLWSYPATSFIAHCRGDSPLAAETPVLIAGNLEQLPQDDYLLNLSDEMPSGFSRFENLVEIISIDDDVRMPARDRVKYYRDRGYDIQFRDLQKEPL